MHAGGTFISAPLRDPTVPGYKDFTPIARMTIEVTSCVVRADSPYKTIKDLVDKAKKGKPGDNHLGGDRDGQHQPPDWHSGWKMSPGPSIPLFPLPAPMRSLRPCWAATWRWAHSAHIAMPLVEAGKLRILAVASEKRLSRFPDLPTFKEQGFDVVLSSHRGFVAPGKISDDAKNSLSGIFEKLSQSSQWKDYVAKEGTDTRLFTRR